MLHILGMIGKGIGFTLLGILILVILLLLAVLFVPIRYRVAGKKEKENFELKGQAKLYWLLRIVTAFAIWEGRLHYGLKIFGIPVYDNIRKEDKEAKRLEKMKKKAARKSKKQKSVKKITRTAETGKENKAESEIRLVSKPAEIKQTQERPPLQSEEKPISEQSKTASEARLVSEGTEKEKKNILKGITERIKESIKALWQKLKDFFQMLLGIVQKVMDFPRKVYEKIQNLKETIDAYRAFIEREDFKRAFALCKKQLYHVWKNIRPKKLIVDIRLGFEDPATTGQILAYAGMLYPFLGKDMRIRPDFENEVLEGNLFIKGRITLFVLLKACWLIYFDKDIKRLIRIWKKEETLHVR